MKFAPEVYFKTKLTLSTAKLAGPVLVYYPFPMHLPNPPVYLYLNQQLFLKTCRVLNWLWLCNPKCVLMHVPLCLSNNEVEQE